jgi:hypothetical protein
MVDAMTHTLTARSQLIDRDVTAHIEIGSFTATARGGNGDRVDVVTP